MTSSTADRRPSLSRRRTEHQRGVHRPGYVSASHFWKRDLVRERGPPVPLIDTESRIGNSEMKSTWFMVPGIIALFSPRDHDVDRVAPVRERESEPRTAHGHAHHRTGTHTRKDHTVPRARAWRSLRWRFSPPKIITPSPSRARCSLCGFPSFLISTLRSRILVPTARP